MDALGCFTVPPMLLESISYPCKFLSHGGGRRFVADKCLNALTVRLHLRICQQDLPGRLPPNAGQPRGG
jgi:hypothetical protein